MWARILTAAIGIWLMVAPALLGIGNPARDNGYIAGPIAASISIIACWQVTRSLRWLNLAIGLWLVVAPWVLQYGGRVETLHDVTAGIVLVALSFVRGRITEQFGGGWRALFGPGASQERFNVPGSGNCGPTADPDGGRR